MDWKKIEAFDDGTVRLPKRWIHLHYYEALNMLFRIENALRVFVYGVLKAAHREKWSQLTTTSDDAEKGTIESIAKKRRSQASKFGYLGVSLPCPVMHLTTGELVSIITSDSYWELFKPHFLGQREVIKTKLDEIGVLRNSLAHFRPMREDDVETIKQNAKHALIGVERYLSQMLHCDVTVPTNSTTDWYGELKTIGTDLVSLALTQSKDENWIQLRLSYRPIVLKRVPYASTYISYVLANLKSPALIREATDLVGPLSYFYESLYSSMSEDGTPLVDKWVSFVFPRERVESDYAQIAGAFRKLLIKISEEAELLGKDSLARGTLIESVSIAAFKTKTKDGKEPWSAGTDGLQCVGQESDPVEYWGHLFFMPGDFIAGAEKYPWMPLTVSADDYGF